MTRTHIQRRLGEQYFGQPELSEQETDAIDEICQIADFNTEVDSPTCVEEAQEALCLFLYNAVQFAGRDAFDITEDAACANLATYAEFLLDALALMSKADKHDLEAMLLASLAAKYMVDTLTGSQKPWDAAWDETLEKSQDLLLCCFSKPTARH